MKTQRTADIVVGCGVALFGIFIIYASSFITGGAPHKLPPDTFPKAVGILLFLCGAGLAVKSWTIRGTDFAIPWPDREGLQIILVTLASLGGYLALMNPLGFPLASFLYIAFSVWYLKRTKWLLALATSLIVAGLSYYLFIRLLGLSFPMGALFD